MEESLGTLNLDEVCSNLLQLMDEFTREPGESLNQSTLEVSPKQIIPSERRKFLNKKYLCKECGEPKPADCGQCRMCLDKRQFVTFFPPKAGPVWKF